MRSKGAHRLSILLGLFGLLGWVVFVLVVTECFKTASSIPWQGWSILIAGTPTSFFIPFWVTRAIAWMFDRESNTIQKVVVAVIAPIVIFVLSYGLMHMINESRHNSDFTPSDLGETWWAWIIVFCAIGTFEYCWFGNRPTKTE